MLQRIFASRIAIPNGRSLYRLAPAVGALTFSLSAGVWLLNISALSETSAQAEQAAANGRLLVDLGRHAALAAAVKAKPVEAKESEKTAQAPTPPVAEANDAKIATLASPPTPPARPAEYTVASAPEPAAVVLVDAPLPPLRPAEYTTPKANEVASLDSAAVDAPLPPERPAGLSPVVRAPTADMTTAPAPMRRMAARETTIVEPAQPADNRGFFERLFGGAEQRPAPAITGRRGRALAYAAPETGGGGVFGGLQSAAVSPVSANFDRYTAVYDISARTVYLPNGQRLEAHSGLREHLDDPRFVHLRMRGATPPNVYALTPREQLFHGVEALRLNPIAGHTYGRAGLLAHTYMLGPNGDSNGCVSFRDYRAFLQAYKNGEVRKLAVVAHM